MGRMIVRTGVFIAAFLAIAMLVPSGVFSVKQISPFSSSEFPIVIVGKSPLSAGLVRKQVPLLYPAA